MADIFISYARADRDRIEKLAVALEGAGLSVWWDRQIVGGAEFSKDIVRELEAAKAVIVAWSQGSIESRWVQDEALTAADAGKLIPICLDGVDAPMGFKQFHVLDLARWNGSVEAQEFQDLSRAVKARLTGERPLAPAAKKTAADKLRKPATLAAIGLVALALIAGAIIMTRGRTPLADATAAVDLNDALTSDGASIAVLPFTDLSENGDQEFFSDGISEEILNVLVRIPELKVAGRTSSFSFKGKNADLREIGATLGVSHLLEGSVRRSGARLRITAQLIRSEDGFHLWSETFDREQTDIFEIQDEIARAIADQLALSLGLDDGAIIPDRTDDIVAYENYLRAKQLFFKRGRDNLEIAAIMLGEVTARDPDYAPAWSALSGIYTVYESYLAQEPPKEKYEQWRAYGKAAALRAIALNPEGGEAYANLGAFQSYSFAWLDAFQAFDRAVELSPETASVLDGYAQLLLDVGYYEEAKIYALRAVSIDPLVAIFRVSLGRTYLHTGEMEKAIETLRKAIELNPQLGFSYPMLISALIVNGQFDEAIAIEDKAVAIGAFTQDASQSIRALKAVWNDDNALRALRDQAPPGQLRGLINRRLEGREDWIANRVEYWASGYRQPPLLFNSWTAAGFRDHPRWKEQVRIDGVLELWRARGFPEKCRPVLSQDGGDDDFECD